MFCTFCQYALEAHFCNSCSDFVVVNQFCIAEHFRFLSEKFIDELVVLFNLLLELVGIDKRSQRVVVSFWYKFNTACICQLFQRIDEFRNVELELFQCCTCDGESNFKTFVAVLNHLQEQFVCRKIGSLCNAGDDFIVSEIVEIIVVVTNIEEAVTF